MLLIDSQFRFIFGTICPKIYISTVKTKEQPHFKSSGNKDAQKKKQPGPNRDSNCASLAGFDFRVREVCVPRGLLHIKLFETQVLPEAGIVYNNVRFRDENKRVD